MVTDSEWGRPPSQEDYHRFEQATYADYLTGCGCECSEFGEIYRTCDFHEWVSRTPEWFNRLVWIRRDLNPRGTRADTEGNWLLEFVPDPPTYYNGQREPSTYQIVWGAKIRGNGRR